VAQIEKITAIPVSIPLREPIKLASETITHAENLVVRIIDSEGIEGWGEAASAPTMTGELLVGMVAAVQRFIGPALNGEPLNDILALQLKIDRSIRANSAAKAAVDIALYDLVGKRNGCPVHQLLGGGRHQVVPVILMLSGHETEELAGALLKAKGNGWSHFKLKVGSEPTSDGALLEHLRKVAGPDVHLAADANMAWDVAAATKFINSTKDIGLAYLEQPLSDDDVEGMARIAANASCPICIDEAVHSVEDITIHNRLNAAKGAGLKLIKLGGYREIARAEQTARKFGWNTTYASKIAETSIGAAAVLHAAALADTVDWGVSLTAQYLTDDLTLESINVSSGRAHVPNAPGLGICINQDKLDRYRID